jgi:hypothetical protein
MQARTSYAKSAPEAVQSMLALSGAVRKSGWNRLNVAFRTPAGDYKSQLRRSAA